MTTTRKLFHYTCSDHGQPGIDRDGFLRPCPQVVIPATVVWLTDLDTPVREALGLTSEILSCDRTEIRYESAFTDSCVPWSTFARSLPRHLREMLEAAPGARPRHWWVSSEPVPVLDRRRAVA